jgi:aspartate 1-decarboxylase
MSTMEKVLTPTPSRVEAAQEVLCLNGPAARRVQKGDVIIIIAYAQMTPEQAKTFKPQIVFPNESTNLLK